MIKIFKLLIEFKSIQQQLAKDSKLNQLYLIDYQS